MPKLGSKRRLSLDDGDDWTGDMNLDSLNDPKMLQKVKEARAAGHSLHGDRSPLR